MSQLLKEDTIFEKAMKKYNYFTDNEDLLNEYDKREAYLVYQHSLMRDFKEEGKLEGIKEGIIEGIEKGKLEGLKEGKLEGIKENSYAIAKTLKQMNMDDASISKATGLTIDEIKKLWILFFVKEPKFLFFFGSKKEPKNYNFFVKKLTKNNFISIL